MDKKSPSPSVQFFGLSKFDPYPGVCRDRVFSWMRSKGSHFILGFWGLRGVFARRRVCLCNRSQPFAAVRNCSRYGPMWPCLRRVLQKWSLLEVSVSNVAKPRFAWQAWRFVTFQHVSCRVESRFVWQARYFWFWGVRSTLETSSVILHVVAGAALRTCRVACFLRIVLTTCKFSGKGGILWHVLKIDGRLARNIDFEVVVTEKTVGKLRFCSYKTWKVEDVSDKMLVLRFQHVSSRFSDLLVASSCQWGKLQNFEGFQRGCGSFCVAVLALRGIFTYLIKCRKSFLCDRRNTFLRPFQYVSCIFRGRHSTLENSIVTLCGRRSISDVSCWHFLRIAMSGPVMQGRVTWCQRANCVAGVRGNGESLILRGKPSIWWRSIVRGMSIFVAGTVFSALYTPHFPLTLYTLHSALDTPHSTLYTLLSTLYTPHSALYTLHSTLSTLHFTQYARHSTLSTFHSTLRTFNSTLYTPHSTLYTPHSTFHNLHFYSLHSTLHTLLLHFTLYTPHSSLYTLRSALYTLHSAVYTVQVILQTPHFTLCPLHSALYTPHLALYTLHPALHTLHFTLYSSHSTLCPLHFTLHNLHSTLHTLHSAVYIIHFSLQFKHSTLYTLLFTLHALPFTLYTSHVTLRTPHFTLNILLFKLHTPQSTLYSLPLHSKLHTTLCTPHFALRTLHFTLAHSTLYSSHSTLYPLYFTFHTFHSTLHTLHFTFCSLNYTSHSTLYTLHSTLYPVQFTPQTSHSTLHALHFTLFTPHFNLQTLHCTLHAPHSTLYTFHSLHFTLYTSHSALDTLHCTLCTPHSALYTPQSTLYTLHSTFHTVRWAVHTPHSTFYTLHFALHTLHSTLCTPHSTFCTLHSTLYTLHSTLYTSHFTPPTLHFTLQTPQAPLHTLHATFPTQQSTFFRLRTLHSTPFHIPLSTAHWYCNRGDMYKSVQLTCFTEVFYATAFGFVGCIFFHSWPQPQPSILWWVRGLVTSLVALSQPMI